MTPKVVEHIPESKTKTVKELVELMKNKKTILVASIKNIPASQFQEIGKKLRGKAIIKVPKKTLTLRAIEESKLKESKKFEENIIESIALLFSDLDAYDLAAELIKNKSPAKAKTGQIAPVDIEIPEGPTELVPGPAISELGALGIQIQIKDGKIEIKQAKVIAKEGDKISQSAADLMSKLDIKPFSIGFTPLVALDNEKGVLYAEIKIDVEATVENLKDSFGKALAFAVSIGNTNEDTIKFLLAKALSHEKALEKLTPVVEEKVEEKPAETEEKPIEEKPKEEVSEQTQTPEEKSEKKVPEQDSETKENKTEEKSEGEENK